MPSHKWDDSKLFQGLIALLAVLGIASHFLIRWLAPAETKVPFLLPENWPLFLVLAIGGLPLVIGLTLKIFRREFSSDLLAGISMVTAVLLDQYLAGAFVVLMLSGGRTLEAFAVQNASSVLEALAKRMPSVAHLQKGETIRDISLQEVRVGDLLSVMPHESCPVDGEVVNGHSTMDEAYLTGEPYLISKGPGSTVLSGSVNGNSALTIRADKLPQDSRYAKIMNVMRDSAQTRPRLRRLGDQLGAVYTPVALALAALAWVLSGDAIRFLAVLVVATPCPLLIAIPVAIIGSISAAARRGIIIKNPVVLEKIDRCRVAIFDKTGTLTYGQPELTEILPAPGFQENEILVWMATLERYSRHPLSGAILKTAEARGLPLLEATEISEAPGTGLRGKVSGNTLQITSRKKFLEAHPGESSRLPKNEPGMECMILVNGSYAGIGRFRDEPRKSGAPFIRHLRPKHHFERVLLLSGDRESEVRYLADKVGIKEIYFGQTPEEKLAFVRKETVHSPTLFMGDGINDAPALTAATVGIAFGQNSDITSEAAGAVILESSLQKVDELFHISRRMRRIALQSAVGGMILSLAGMVLAAFGYLPPVAGAVAQEGIDVLAVLNSLRAALPPKVLSDFERE